MLGWAFAAKRLEYLASEAPSKQPTRVGFYVWENGSPKDSSMFWWPTARAGGTSKHGRASRAAITWGNECAVFSFIWADFHSSFSFWISKKFRERPYTLQELFHCVSCIANILPKTRDIQILREKIVHSVHTCKAIRCIMFQSDG